MSPLLQIENVSKSYAADVVAVRAVNLEVAEHDILCLLGPSGCGKTTLLRMIAGLELPDAGVVRFAGQDMAAVRPHERSFGMMFQDFALFPHLNVYDNIAFGLKFHRLPAAEMDARVREMLALVALEGKETRGMAELSGGEQQRVALARSLAPRPRLLLLDEPLGALDRALRERLMLDVRDILKQVGLTAIYVTHDQTEAFAVADRLAVMNAGRIEQVDTPQHVYRAPASPFVATFFGLNNLLPGDAGADGVVTTGVGRFSPAGVAGSASRESVTLLIRPTAASVRRSDGDGESPAALNTIQARVAACYFRGRYRQLWVAVGDTSLLFEIDPEAEYMPGDEVVIAVEPTGLLLY